MWYFWKLIIGHWLRVILFFFFPSRIWLWSHTCIYLFRLTKYWEKFLSHRKVLKRLSSWNQQLLKNLSLFLWSDPSSMISSVAWRWTGFWDSVQSLHSYLVLLLDGYFLQVSDSGLALWQSDVLLWFTLGLLLLIFPGFQHSTFDVGLHWLMNSVWILNNTLKLVLLAPSLFFVTAQPSFLSIIIKLQYA